ncbi:hypothetical protein ACAW63_05275 [Pseudomonas sp. QE6]|uniref:hypothetical protein n=1 Tax=Pseudomonas sp. QE6 TaxID=3242491 RepID=UPI003526FAA7
MSQIDTTHSGQHARTTVFSVARYSGWVAVALCVLVFLFEFRMYPVEQLDDAFISYRYAQNLVAGHGLVFNIGEPVEGYTNLLWTLLVALGIVLGGDAVQVGGWLVQIFGTLLLVASYVYASRLLAPSMKGWAGWAPIVLLASNSFACWTGGGLETTLFGYLVLMAFIDHLERRFGRVAFWCVLATMTRPEGAILAGVLLGGSWLQAALLQRPRDLAGWWRLSLPSLAFAAYLAAHTAFRLYYYHDVVPNTFYAKVGGIPLSRGFEYLYNAGVDGPILLVFPALLAAFAFRRFRIAMAYILITFAYIVYVGGDVFAFGRFTLPVLPLLTAGAIAGVLWLWSKQRAAGVLLGLLLPATIIWSLWLSWPRTIDHYDLEPALSLALAKRDAARLHIFGDTEEGIRNYVQRMTALRPAPKLVAAVGIGKFGYYAKDVEILDVLGLVDKHVARSTKVVPALLLIPGHQRTDSDYVLDRKPDFILILRRDTPGALTLPSTVDLWTNPRLDQEYRWDSDFNAYRRRDYLGQ